ncbi:hypothetical protein LCGC14_2507210 [marine sediment metagenome]|uniref:DUF7574 domain-containing protein n=1 Tax=marine sediment metagenome TaxID=412755 RepID=A0A0F9B0Y8_9ZZZZ
MSTNIYYSPEKFGLEVFAEFEYSDACYQFDTRVVWKDKNGQLWTAADCGCSCPTPFEDFHLDNIDKLTSTDEIRSEWHRKLRGSITTEGEYQYRVRKIDKYLKER